MYQVEQESPKGSTWKREADKASRKVEKIDAAFVYYQNSEMPGVQFRLSHEHWERWRKHAYRLNDGAPQ